METDEQHFRIIKSSLVNSILRFSNLPFHNDSDEKEFAGGKEKNIITSR